MRTTILPELCCKEITGRTEAYYYKCFIISEDPELKVPMNAWVKTCISMRPRYSKKPPYMEGGGIFRYASHTSCLMDTWMSSPWVDVFNQIRLFHPITEELLYKNLEISTMFYIYSSAKFDHAPSRGLARRTNSNPGTSIARYIRQVEYTPPTLNSPNFIWRSDKYW